MSKLITQILKKGDWQKFIIASSTPAIAILVGLKIMNINPSIPPSHEVLLKAIVLALGGIMLYMGILSWWIIITLGDFEKKQTGDTK